MDAWDTRKGMARLKGFERGETANDPGISGALSGWNEAGGLVSGALDDTR